MDIKPEGGSLHDQRNPYFAHACTLWLQLACIFLSMADFTSSSSDSEGGEELDECLVELSTLPSSNLKQVLSSMLGEELIASSSMSPKVCSIVSKCPRSDRLNSIISQEIQKCFNLGKPNATISLLKILSLSDSIKTAWDSYMTTLQFSSDVRVASDLTLQIVLKKMLQEVVQQMTVKKNPIVSPVLPQTLTPREEKGVRYMAGYVAVKTPITC